MPLIYSFVARASDKVVLAEYSAYAGNFHAVATEVLSSLERLEEKFTITADKHTFNFLVAQGYVFLVVADEAYGRQIPFGYLDRVRDAFLERYADKGTTAGVHSLDRAFGPVIKRQMEYCMEHPEEISKVASVQRQVEEVKSIMVQNVESVLARGEKLDVLVDKTDDLRDQAAKFQRQGTILRKRMWWQNMRMKLIVGGGVLLLVGLIIFFSVCFSGATSCFGSSSPPAPAPNTLVPGSPVPAPAPVDGSATATGR